MNLPTGSSNINWGGVKGAAVNMGAGIAGTAERLWRSKLEGAYRKKFFRSPY